jgi:hypothetical protein
MTTIYKSVHIKECWPFEYVQPTKRIFKKATIDRANARKREQYQQKKLLKLKVYELNIDFCNELNERGGL